MADPEIDRRGGANFLLEFRHTTTHIQPPRCSRGVRGLHRKILPYFGPNMNGGWGVPLYILDVIDSTDTIVPNKHDPYARCWSAAVFIADFFTFHPLVTGPGYSCAISTPRRASVMQPFRHIELIVHHSLPGSHSHLCQVKYMRVSAIPKDTNGTET